MWAVLLVVGVLFVGGVAFYVYTARQVDLAHSKRDIEAQYEAGYSKYTNKAIGAQGADNHSGRTISTAPTEQVFSDRPMSPYVSSGLQQPYPMSQFPLEDFERDTYYRRDSEGSEQMSDADSHAGRISRSETFNDNDNDEDEAFFPPVGPSLFDELALQNQAAPESQGFFPSLLSSRLQDVNLKREISFGAHCISWLGQYRDEKVVVKRILENSNLIDEFADGIAVMSGLIHPCIVHFIGCTWTFRSDLSVVTEYIEGSDLQTLLHTEDSCMNWKEKISIAINIAQALSYLHSLKPIVLHGCLKSRKVMIDQEYNAKLSDFSFSKVPIPHDILSTRLDIVRWTAPELILEGNDDAKADIYSFGIVLSELDTHRFPFDDYCGSSKLSRVEIIAKITAGELRPSFRSNCPTTIYEIAQRCLSLDPKERPTSQSLVDSLIEAQSYVEA
ncbi:hypothetical protein ABG067_001013 [Albugo candida]